jgi:hypothetical protein
MGWFPFPHDAHCDQGGITSLMHSVKSSSCTSDEAGINNLPPTINDINAMAPSAIGVAVAALCLFAGVSEATQQSQRLSYRVELNLSTSPGLVLKTHSHFAGDTHITSLHPTEAQRAEISAENLITQPGLVH